MVHLYLDENVDVLLYKLLGARNIKVTTTLESKMLRKGDTNQLDFASSINAAIVTHNRGDFQKLFADYIKHGKEFFGIIITEYRSVHELAQRLVNFLSEHDDITNQIWYV